MLEDSRSQRREGKPRSQRDRLPAIVPQNQLDHRIGDLINVAFGRASHRQASRNDGRGRQHSQFVQQPGADLTTSPLLVHFRAPQLHKSPMRWNVEATTSSRMVTSSSFAR